LVSRPWQNAWNVPGVGVHGLPAPVTCQQRMYSVYAMIYILATSRCAVHPALQSLISAVEYVRQILPGLLSPGSGHSPHHHHPPIYNVKRSTVIMYKIDSTGSGIWGF